MTAMSLKRTAILLAVSHSNHHASNNSSNIGNSLSSGGSSSHSNATDFYANKSYNNQSQRVLKGAGGFNGNVNILLGG